MVVIVTYAKLKRQELEGVIEVLLAVTVVQSLLDNDGPQTPNRTRVPTF
jgi:hypothetical protein